MWKKKIAHSSGTLISDSKYLGWGDLEVLMGEQQNGHLFSFFLFDSLSKETMSVGKYQGETYALRD